MATCESNNFIFQVLDWDFTHKEVDEDKRYYVIQMFGKTKDQKTVYVEFTDFKPFFYIRINPTWTNTVIQTLIEEIKKNMKKKMDEEDEDGNMKWKNVGDGLISTNVVEAEKFLGFTAGKKFKFLQLNFDDYEIMKKCEYACKRIYKLPMVKYVIKLEIFESNILPLIRFMHIRGLDAVGWVSIPIDKLISNTYQKSCCDINYRTKWNNVSKVDDVTISKFDILSFDIECTSTDGSFPQADRDGDKVIQIGATFSRFGESECYKRYLLALNETDVVEDCEVQWYEKEEELLLAFTKLLRQTNPDIITGYNICGFDFLYLHKRAEYLSKKMQPSEGNKFLRSFEKMSRINNEVCEWKEAKLSSSALGDNILKYYKMTGRVIIDLMKVAQRDYKLSSYKLDYVAANFIKENIVNLLCDNAKSKDGKCEYKLETKNTFGLQNGNFITIIYSDGTGAIDEKYNEGEKFQIYNLQQKSFCIKGNIDTSEFMGKGYKIFWSQVKDDIKARDIFKLFKQTPQDRAIIAKYCVMDCELCNKLMTKLQIITNNVGMANVCNVPLSYLFLRGQGVKIFSLVAKKCREKNFIIPVIQKKKIFENKDNDNKDKPQNQVYKKKLNDCDELDEKQLDKLVYELSNKTNKKNEEVGNDEEDEGYEGAIVFEPIAGVYLEPIPVLDFASLYPSAMILRNLSHEMFVNDPMYDNLHGYRYHTIWYKKNNGETVTCKFAEKRDGTKGIIPEILMYLLTTRKKYKKMMNDTSDPFIYSIYDGLQQAYKVTSNSLYGQTGGTHSPICLKEIAASTTATGREMLQFSKYFIENIFSKTINLALSDKEQYYKLMNETFLYHPTSYVVKDNKNEDITIHVNTDEYDKINDKKFIKNSIGYEVSYEFPNEKKIIDELKAEKKSISWENILTKMNYIDEWNKLIKWVNDVVFKLPIEQRHLIKNNLSKIGKITKKLNIVNIFDSIDVSDDVLEYFKTNLTILIDNSGYDNKQQFFDKFYCFANELLEGYSIDAKIIYGDSVTGDTPLLLLNKKNEIVIKTVNSIGNVWKNDIYHDEKFIDDNIDYKVWTEKGWSKIKKVIKHRTNKKIYEVFTHSGCVKVTEDHSLLNKNGEMIKPTVCDIGTELLHSFPNIEKKYDDISYNDLQLYRMYHENEKFIIKSQIQAQHLYYLLSTFRLNGTKCENIRIEKQEDNYVIYKGNTEDTENKDKITSIQEVKYNEIDVYDLETENHHFQAGIGNIIVHNTDSVFFCSHIKNNETGELLKNKHALYIGIRLGIWASICISTLLPAPMAQEYEKVLWPFIIQGKKRYVGNLYEKDPDHFKQKSMGIELKRRDNAPIVKTVSAGIIDQILNKLSPEGAFEFTKDILNKIIFKQFKIDKFIITKTLKGNALTKKEREEEQKKPKEQRVYVDRTRIVHAVLADRMADRDPGNRPLSNDRIPYAYIITKFEPELQGDRVETPDYIVENNLELDFLFYITNQIMKPALKFLDLITTNAHGLFKEYIIREENRKNNILPITYYSKNNIEENVDEFIKNNVNDDIIIKKIKKKTQKKKSKKIEANTNTNSIKDSKSLLDGF
ncbi:intein-containing DNA-dependent DNA polymerase family B precursor [Bodo saltans virus]|uniref:DNA-directed DNA polymerase n=2 Tax=Bodo saltans virus TaxID=2024608 RepID=A0A2H4UV00_9VIRU|nr:intein-containing DNA-dependent DNA polymerase family B precursor [Bodo saltans virus]ATZ80752.1 intein-containing DNA-dependent DNA polymerase family B precursor [Bodo saltans virus]